MKGTKRRMAEVKKEKANQSVITKYKRSINELQISSGNATIWGVNRVSRWHFVQSSTIFLNLLLGTLPDYHLLRVYTERQANDYHFNTL